MISIIKADGTSEVRQLEAMHLFTHIRWDRKTQISSWLSQQSCRM